MKMLRSLCLVLLAAGALISTGCGGSGSDPAPPTVPAAPTGVAATPGNGSVSLSWAAVAGATSYNVYWSTTAGVTKATGTRIAGAVSPHAHLGLANGTTYYYVVTAVGAVGESAASAQASAVPATNPPPAAPTGVAATRGNGQNRVAWSNVTGAASYNVYWSTSAGVTTVSGTKVTGAPNPFVHDGLTNGTTYYYVVTAVNGSGESTTSGEASAAPAAAPYIKALVLSVQGGTVPPFGFLEQVGVCTDSTCTTDITTATVTVNGLPLTYAAQSGQFEGIHVIAAGATVTVAVTTGGTTYSVTGTQFTGYPTITSPAAGATWSRGSANTISWSGGSPALGATYVVGVLDGAGQFSFPVQVGEGGGPMEIPTSTTSVVVPANTVPVGSAFVMVGIGSPGLVQQASGGIAIPNAAAGSGLWLGALPPFAPITVN